MSNEVDVVKEETTELVARNDKGQLQPGSKLGKGRVKGSKNKATILREKMENKVSIKLSKLAPKVVDKVGKQAIDDGCRQSQKMILDRVAPVRKAEDGASARDTSVHITISDLTRENVHEVHDINGECEVVEE